MFSTPTLAKIAVSAAKPADRRAHTIQEAICTSGIVALLVGRDDALSRSQHAAVTKQCTPEVLGLDSSRSNPDEQHRFRPRAARVRNDLAALCISDIAARQERAKRLDLRRHEIGEGPHSGVVLHVAVHEQVIGDYQSDIVYDTNKVTTIPLQCGIAASPAPALTASITPCQCSLRAATVAWGATDRSHRAPG